MIRKKVILIFFVVILAAILITIYKFYANSPKEMLQFHGKSTFDEVQKIVSEQGYKFFIQEDQHVERGNARFTLAKVEQMDTGCGRIDVMFSFFNNELAYIKYISVSKENIKSSICMGKVFSKENIYGDKISKQAIDNNDKIHYDVIFSDLSVEDKMNQWIGKWS
ncbi:hypothetical protein I2492_08075 [Budviciaceae bacterium CWB-B4]|uniref:Uncharacterized protein n=1 Tax=Limnobaculum xujianqingii TaxID=2738837 RepID=A0A9D7AHL7_9GAMM|nr:hypothetical protein [Limnobaculum xujianqingii]MBK5072970.1 hypothetical protein [Limnobaculum xujianqingii]MBK5176279.1 hypothetical protein [Limnobaculum xujianqingii]